MTIRFVEEAQHELLDAISFYEEARAGLGRRFKDHSEFELKEQMVETEFGLKNYPAAERLYREILPKIHRKHLATYKIFIGMLLQGRREEVDS